MKMKHKILFVFTLIILTFRVAKASEITIEDFDGGGVGGARWGGAHATAFGIASISSDIHFSPVGSSWKIQWSGVDAINEWAGGGVSNMVINASAYNAVSIWLYTPNANTDVSIELSDTDDDKAKILLADYLTTGTSTWQNVIVPLDAFIRKNKDIETSKFKGINIIADFGLNNDSSGIVYIDDIKLVTLSHAPAGSIIYSGGDYGIANSADMPGDTIVWWDEAVSSQTVNEVSATVLNGYALSWASTPSDVLSSGATYCYLPYSIRNDGNSADAIVFSTSTVSGASWPAKVYWDKNKDGAYNSSDIEWYDSIGLLPDSTHYFLVRVDASSAVSDSQSAIMRVTARDLNGLGTNDAWPSASNDDTITDNFTVTVSTTAFDTTAPVITAVNDLPLKIGMTGNKLIVSANIIDSESTVLSIKLYYSVNSAVLENITFDVSTSSLYTTDFKDTIPQSGTLSYFWQATNSYAYSAVSSTRTVTISDITSSESIISGTLTVEDGNPNDGETSILIPAGALDNASAFTIQKLNSADFTQVNDLSLSAQPSTVYEIGPATIFKKPVTLTLLYMDINDDNIEDVTGKDEQLMKIFWWDGIEWRLIGGKVDADKKTVTAQVMHLSRYAVFPSKALAGSDLRPKERIITPSGSPGVNDYAQFGTGGEFTVNIYDINGTKVRALKDGSSIWQGEDENGNTVESGVYIYQIKSAAETISGTIVVAK